MSINIDEHIVHFRQNGTIFRALQAFLAHKLSFQWFCIQLLRKPVRNNDIIYQFVNCVDTLRATQVRKRLFLCDTNFDPCKGKLRLKYGFCKKLLLSEWNSGQLNIFVITFGWVCCCTHPKVTKKKCSTAQSFICKEVTSYKICILV